MKRGRDRAGIPEKCGVVAANLNQVRGAVCFPPRSFGIVAGADVPDVVCCQIYKATPAAFDAWLEVMSGIALRTHTVRCPALTQLCDDRLWLRMCRR